MKHARRLRRQLDDWQQLWRQVDAFVDRLETARDEDDAPARKTDALLAAAGAVERVRRAAGTGDTPLGDPVVDRVPTTGWDVTSRRTESIDPWDPANRPARLPGNDEVELAVADLATVDIDPLGDGGGSLLLDAVRLLPARDTLTAELGGELQMLRVPSYPGTVRGGAGIITAGQVDLAGEDNLFSVADRAAATTSIPPEDPDDAEPFVKAWSALARSRRVALGSVAEPPPLASAGVGNATAATGPTLSAALLDQAAACALDAIEGRAARLPPGAHLAVAADLAAAATAAAGAAASDAGALRAAADLLDTEGVDSAAEDLAGQLRAAADAVAAAPAALQALAATAGGLATALAANPPGPFPSGSVAAATGGPARAVQQALAGVPRSGGLAGVLTQAAENGLLAMELDVVLAERLAYPGGSLRILRALEASFARWWPGAVGWMAIRARPGRPLDRAMRRFLDPFVAGLRGLISDGTTGFALSGLTLGTPASIGANLLVAEAPAALATPVRRSVEAGQLVVLPATRPAAAVVLGVGRQVDRLAFQVTGLRVSLVPPDLAPGSPGQVAAGVALAGTGTPVTAAELRRGFADDPARDGLVEQAVALHSQLALLLGRADLAARLASPAVPDPAGPALAASVWHGEVAPMTTSFVLHGGPDAWWDRTGDSPVPVFARPGELLLLRGEVPPDPDGATPGTAQTVVEVDRAVWLPGAMLNRVDTTRSALLATDPAVLGTVGDPTIVCGPRDDLVLLTLRRTWQAGPLTGPVTLRRDFTGFDLATLAIGQPLGDALVLAATGAPPRGPAGVDRALELSAANGLLDDWTRHARD